MPAQIKPESFKKKKKLFSFMCYFSKLEHIAHHKEQKHSQKKLTHTVNRIACRGVILKMIWKMCVWWPNFAWETDSAAQEKDLWSSNSMH